MYYDRDWGKEKATMRKEKSRTKRFGLSKIFAYLFIFIIMLQPQIVRAAAPSGIAGNGTSGIWIDINAAPYTTYANQSYGQYAYTASGCAWFASARVNQLTGANCPIWSGKAWYNSGYSQYGFSRGSALKAKALACYESHVAVVEAVSGNTVTVSEGGYSGVGSANGYCSIHTMSKATLESARGGNFIGYVYLGVGDSSGNGTPGALSISARSTYYTDEDITFSWNTPANTATYGISLYTRPSSGNRVLVYDKASVTGNSYNIGKWGAGNYRLWMAPYNANGTSGTAVYVDISVTNRPVTYVTGISLNRSSMTLTKGQSGTLSVTVSPSNATNKSVSWTSSNSQVATVSNGTVKAVGAGTATITARAADGSGKTASCAVTVKESHTHSYTARITRSATCTATGIKTYTCSCGANYTETIAKTAHNPVVDKAVAATCTTAGKTEGSHCSVCNTVIKAQQTIPATGHSYTGKVLRDSTCSREGVKSYTCSCGASYTERIPVKPHTYGPVSVSKATLNKDGSTTQKCTGCGEKQSTTIARPKSVKFSKTSYTYNGRVQKPVVVVTDRQGKKLQSGTDYTVSYSKGCKKVGTYTATIKFKGNYSGKTKKTFTIGPKGTQVTGYQMKYKISVNGGQVKFNTSATIYWKKQASQTSGYELQYSTSKKFVSGKTKTVRIDKANATTKTLTKLKNNQTYYVRIRTYKTVRDNGKTTKVYSSWSTSSEIPSSI